MNLKFKLNHLALDAALWTLLGTAALARQMPLQEDYLKAPQHQRVITPAVSEFVQDVIQNAQIGGMSVGVVELGSGQRPAVEFATWGNRTEEDNGADLKPNVCTDGLYAFFSAPLPRSRVVDTVCTRLLLKSIPCHVDWSSHR